MPEPKEPTFEVDALKYLIASEGWSLFTDMVEEHKKNLEWQMQVAVSNRKYEDASDYYSRVSECKKILQLVDNRLVELSTKEKR